METRKEAIARLEPTSLLVLGRVAHIQDRVDVLDGDVKTLVEDVGDAMHRHPEAFYTEDTDL